MASPSFSVMAMTTKGSDNSSPSLASSDVDMKRNTSSNSSSSETPPSPRSMSDVDTKMSTSSSSSSSTPPSSCPSLPSFFQDDNTNGQNLKDYLAWKFGADTFDFTSGDDGTLTDAGGSGLAYKPKMMNNPDGTPKDQIAVKIFRTGCGPDEIAKCRRVANFGQHVNVVRLYGSLSSILVKVQDNSARNLETYGPLHDDILSGGSFTVLFMECLRTDF